VVLESRTEALIMPAVVAGRLLLLLLLVVFGNAVAVGDNSDI